MSLCEDRRVERRGLFARTGNNSQLAVRHGKEGVGGPSDAGLTCWTGLELVGVTALHFYYWII